DEYLDIIYWLRQIVGLVFGVVWGIIPLYGILGIGIFGIANAGLLYLYFTYYQPADEEEVGDTWELTKEGFMSSFSIFLVAWIMTYSGVHFH
ncbi:uncharacterized protein TRIADDRAFT_24387, partial [Trichoplax adhaerens]